MPGGVEMAARAAHRMQASPMHRTIDRMERRRSMSRDHAQEVLRTEERQAKKTDLGA